MYIDFKITTWERVRIDDSIKEDVLAKLKSGEISSSNDLFDFYEEGQFEYDSSILIETSEQMTPSENNNQSTIEVYGDEEEDIWTNKS